MSPNAFVMTEERFNELLVKLQCALDAKSSNRLYPFGILAEMAPAERKLVEIYPPVPCVSRGLVLAVDEEFVTLEEAKAGNIPYVAHAVPGKVFNLWSSIDPFVGKLFIPGEPARFTFENQSGHNVRLRGAWIVETLKGAFG